MPFHFFHPLPPPILPIILSAALAFAAGAYLTRRSTGHALARAARRTAIKARHWRRSSHHEHTSPAAENTGNAAFDAYRAETLKALEKDAAEFRDFLDRLRHTEDKEAFDAFLKDRARNQN